MLASNAPSPGTIPFPSPAIDTTEVAWAMQELQLLYRQTHPNSVVGRILSRTLNELTSLNQAQNDGVVGPVRIRAVA